MSMLAHKVAIRVGLFNVDWDVKMAATKNNPSRSPELVRSSPDDLFGGADVNIEDLEVFGADSKVSPLRQKYEKGLLEVKPESGEDNTDDKSNDDGMKVDTEVLGQVDGGW